MVHDGCQRMRSGPGVATFSVPDRLIRGGRGSVRSLQGIDESSPGASVGGGCGQAEETVRPGAVPGRRKARRPDRSCAELEGSVLRGDASFTLATMVKLARAFDMELKLHLARSGVGTRWEVNLECQQRILTARIPTMKGKPSHVSVLAEFSGVAAWLPRWECRDKWYRPSRGLPTP